MLALALAAALYLPSRPATPAPGPRSQDTLDAVRAAGELTWGGDVQGGEPYAFEDPRDHHLVGFEVDLAGRSRSASA